MASGLIFLQDWVQNWLNPTVRDDKRGAAYLAEECLRDAESAGVDRVELVRAAGGDLTQYMLDRLNVAVELAERRRGRPNGRTR